MALQPAVQFNFDGLLPYSSDGTPDAEGIYHAYKIKQGSTATVIFNFPSVTVASYNFKSEFRRGYGSGNPVQATGVVTKTGTNQITLTLTAADLASGDFEAASGVWDIEATTIATGEIDRWIQGTYDVTPEVTLS